MQPQVLYEVAAGIGTITLARPEAMNAFGGTMREDLLGLLERAAADRAVRCVVITGAGKAFCAGGDIANMVELQAGDDVSVIRQRMQIGGEVIRLMRAMPKPVVAAVNGAAAGAGLNLALACDMRIAAASARFAASFVRIGLVPDWGGTHFLTRVLGAAKAMELMMTGDLVDAGEALRLGLVSRVVPDERFRDEAAAFARRLATGPADALAAIKRATWAGATGTLDDSLRLEAELQCDLFLSADSREGMRAFVEKRAPKFT